jgi:hypothetical protein
MAPDANRRLPPRQEEVQDVASCVLLCSFPILPCDSNTDFVDACSTTPPQHCKAALRLYLDPFFQARGPVSVRQLLYALLPRCRELDCVCIHIPALPPLPPSHNADKTRPLHHIESASLLSCYFVSQCLPETNQRRPSTRLTNMP